MLYIIEKGRILCWFHQVCPTNRISYATSWPSLSVWVLTHGLFLLTDPQLSGINDIARYFEGNGSRMLKELIQNWPIRHSCKEVPMRHLAFIHSAFLVNSSLQSPIVNQLTGSHGQVLRVHSRRPTWLGPTPKCFLRGFCSSSGPAC